MKCKVMSVCLILSVLLTACGGAALAAGMRLVLVPDLAYLSDDLKNRAFKVIEDLSKIIDVIKEENERATSI